MANSEINSGHKSRVCDQTKEQIAIPSLFKVLMHNDDYTTMEFVIAVLRDVFHKPEAEAEQIMLTIHFQGVGYCGTFPQAIAETKADQARLMARKAGFPLRCTLEEV
ncbi:MAG: ATP-dependent Clp protease adaptor ClpS [Desulfuromusa sp.]|nr:ATP-dependent Clp protease adaptor ClpS [Desulfuromusa sp.]